MKQASLEGHLFIVLSLLNRAGKDLENHLQVGNHSPKRKGSWPSSWPYGRSHPLPLSRAPPLSTGSEARPQVTGDGLQCKEIFACVLKVKKNLNIWFHCQANTFATSLTVKSWSPLSKMGLILSP